MFAPPPTGSECAETDHAPIRLLADSRLTIGSKQNSAELGHGFRSVAKPAASPSLPLCSLVRVMQQPGRRRWY
jgi:hypothetical protein